MAAVQLNSRASLWAFRSVVWEMAIREFRTRYAGSVLGSAWSVLHPISLILIFTFVFSRVMAARLPGVSGSFAYGIYLCAGLFPWTAFAETAQRSASAFLDNRSLIQKLRFPIEAPVAWIATFSLLNSLLTLGLLVILVLAVVHKITLSFLALPLLLALMQVWAFGLGLALASLTVFFRDLSQMVVILFQFWFWLTPIVYVQGIVPPKFHALQAMNPMFHIMQGFHRIVMEGGWPKWTDVVVLLGMALFNLAFGYAVVSRLRADIPDEI
jgi:lipopolysaccharide transport system permease protein